MVYIEKLGELLRGKSLIDETIVIGLGNFDYDTPIDEYMKLFKKANTLLGKMEKKIFS